MVLLNPDVWKAFCTEVPGCHTQSETIKKGIVNIYEAVQPYVESLVEDGLPVTEKVMLIKLIERSLREPEAADGDQPRPPLSFRGGRRGDRRGICFCEEEKKKQIRFARNDRWGDFHPDWWAEAHGTLFRNCLHLHAARWL